MTASKSLIFDEQDYEMEVHLVDVDGSIVTGATVNYELRKAEDNDLIESGTLTELSSTGVYTKTISFSLGVGITQKEFRITYATTGFPIGVESLVVVDLVQVIEIEITADIKELLGELVVGGRFM